MIDAALRHHVRSRAGDRCEYCQLPESRAEVAPFHIEHVIARQHGGADELSNLALACYHCNLHKGPNLAGSDPESGAMVPLFNPRTQRWQDHFELRDTWIVGLSPTGRATVRVLAINAELPRELRAQTE